MTCEPGAPPPVLEIDDARVTYHQRGGGRDASVLRAVDGVTLTVHAGESLAIVGESGCGKSSLARAAVGLERLAGGHMRMHGTVVAARRSRAEQRRIQMVFQDPGQSLNPRRRVGRVLSELLRVHRLVASNEITARCEELMTTVGLPTRTLDAYPHQLSGGQRQRVGIARALAVEPDVLVADEPVSALDVSVQATILSLLEDLQAQLGLALVFISHDLGVVRHLCDRVAVMYLGRIVEQGSTAELFENPRHPYTQALLAAAPSLVHPVRPGSSGLQGEPPSATELISGCRFARRCAHAIECCTTDDPAASHVVDGATRDEHLAWCHVLPAAPRTAVRGHPETARSSN